jgi:glycerophosphoryl diester phosphodiesterase
MGEANIWEPRKVLQTSADTKELIQDYIAVGGESKFTLTDFSYITDTGGLAVFKNGVRLLKDTEWVEQTESTFLLLTASVVTGDVISAVAFTGITYDVLVDANNLTTIALVASTGVYSSDSVLSTTGYATSGDGGISIWKQNGVTGQTVSQTPTQLDDELLNDGLGNQWALVIGQNLDFTSTQFFPLPFGAEGPGSYMYGTDGFKKVITSQSLDWNGVVNKNRLQLIAHRGFRRTYPESTMVAFTSAVSAGANAIECDVQITSDGVPIIFHDITVDLLTSGTGAVTSLTLAEIQALTFTSTVGTVLAGCRIPTFLDALRYCKSAGIEMYPEIKGFRALSDVSLMLADIISAGMLQQVFMQSFSIDTLEYTRTLNSTVSLGLTGSTTVQVTYESLIDRVAALGGNGFIYWTYASLLSTPAIITYAKSKSVDIGSWTVNDADNAKELMKLGVNKIMSDIYIGVL